MAGFDQSDVRACIEPPDKSHIDGILAFSERTGRENAADSAAYAQPLVGIEEQTWGPLRGAGENNCSGGEATEGALCKTNRHRLKVELNGMVRAIYPYDDPMAIACNDEEKLMGMDLNRGLRDDTGSLYDIVAGTFLAAGLGEEDFTSLSPELIQKFTEQFRTPELLVPRDGKLVVLPVPEQAQEKAYLPDKFETGGHVQTPRGNFCVTALS